jgi:hypothetical protein
MPTPSSASAATLGPVVFAVMPYGRRRHPDTGVEIDFDAVWEHVIVPAATTAGCHAVRSDHEALGGLVHASMFERLLLADVVVADISLPNPNVFYELGVRHAARPRTTITIGSTVTPAPFDVAPLRHVLYPLDGHLPADPSALAETLAARITAGLAAPSSTDSPIFQTIVGYPGIELSHESSESYRDRAVAVINTRRELRHYVMTNDRAGIDRVAAAVGTSGELLADVTLAYRDIAAWDEMLAALARCEPLAGSPAGIELEAFARNRRNAPDDRRIALALLHALEGAHGTTSERASLKGRILKDLWLAHRDTPGALAYLLDAIDAYRSGLEADPRDPLPGVNLLVLLAVAGMTDEIARVAPVVAFAVARRGGLDARDHFDLMAHAVVSAVIADWPATHRAVHRAVLAPHAAWMLKSAAETFALLGPHPEIDAITAVLDTRLAAMP